MQGDLAIGVQPGSQGTYTLNSGTLSVTGQVSVGGQSTGTNQFIQNGGTLNVNTPNTDQADPNYVGVGSALGGCAPGGTSCPFVGALSVGGGMGTGAYTNTGGSGSYTLNNDGIVNAYNVLIGGSGTGTMTQSGTSTVNTTYMTMGFNQGTSGTYTLNSGTVNAYAATVGNYGSGFLTIGDGTDVASFNTTTTLDVGAQQGGSGTVFQLANSTVNDDLIVGDAGSGTYTNTGAVHNVTGNAILGNQSTGNGTYTITDDTVNMTTGQLKLAFAGTPGDSPGETPNGALIVGNAGTGSFIQGTGTDAPTVSVAGDVALGLQFGSNGTYNLNSGNLTVGGLMIVGAASTNDNVFSQTGGTVTITGFASSNSLYAPVSSGAVPATSPGSLYVGGESVFDNGTGTYTLAAGNLNVAANLEVGFSGTGTVNQSGGAVTAGYLDLGGCGGCNGGNSAGFYNLTGTGTITAFAETVGDFGHGEFTQGAIGDAGATMNTVNGTLSIGNSATATPNDANPMNWDRSGTYTLNSGTLNTQNADVGNGSTGTLIQNGGTHNVSFLLDVGVQNQALSGPVGSGTAANPVFGGPAPGTYTMNGGTLTVGGGSSVGVPQFATAYPFITGSTAGMIIGDAGDGVFNQFGASTVTTGTPQVPNTSAGAEGDVIIGAQGAPVPVSGSSFTGTGQGTYNLGQTGQSAAPSLTVNGSVIIGRDAGANGGTIPGIIPTNANLVIQGDGTNLSVFYNGGGIAEVNPLSSDIMVGLSGNGAVLQQDNTTVYMDGDLSIGINKGAVGSYNLNATANGGNLTVGNFLNIGGVGGFVNCCNEQTTPVGGTGYFTQTSGDVYVAQTVFVGNNGGTGTYTMSGGTLAAANFEFAAVGLVVGNSGNGVFNQSGGSVTTGTGPVGGYEGDLIIGAQSGGLGSYSITGDTSTLTVNGNILIAQNPGTAGSSMTIGSGTDTPTVTVQSDNGGYLTVGAGDKGTLTINSGSLNVAAITFIGGSPTGVGTVSQTGGSFNTGNIDIGTVTGTGSPNNSYTLSNGSLTVLGALVIGSGTPGGQPDGSGGTFTQTNGSVTVGDAYINNGSYNLSGGTFTANDDVRLGDTKTGALFNQTAGTASITNDLLVGGTFATAPSPIVATYDLSGGTLTVGGNVVLGVNTPGQGTFNYNVNTGDSAEFIFSGSGQNLVVGDAGTGTFNEGSSTNTTDLNLQNNGTSLDIGRSLGGIGTFNLAAGSSLEDDMIVGDSGTGTFNNNAGTNTVGTSGTPANLILGNQSTGIGTYNNNGGSNTINGNLVVGSAGTGTYNLGNGTSGATLNVNGTGLSGGNVDVGQSGTGTITTSNAAVADIAGVLVLGGPSPGETAANGTLTVTGGAQWVNEGQTQIGGFGTGTLNVLAGGSLTSFAGGSGSGTSGALGDGRVRKVTLRWMPWAAPAPNGTIRVRCASASLATAH